MRGLIGWLAMAAIALGWTGTAIAADYRPVTCSERQNYRGAPARSPVNHGLAGEIPHDPVTAETAAWLDAVFGKIQEAAQPDAMGIAVGRIDEGVWAKSMMPEGTTRLWWASAGKAFVATVVLQLVEERKLTLDDPVSRWVAGLPNGDLITVRDLLAHTSGLYSANEDPRIGPKPHLIAPEEMMAILRQHGAMFCPGAQWRYSNSGYDLLAMIVQAVDRRPLANAIESRILLPLGLSGTIALRPGVARPEVALPASTRVPASAMTQPWDAGAGGPIAADAADMLRFWQALLGGRLLRPETVDTMFLTLYPMFDAGTFYGLGAMVLDVRDAGRSDVWIGHAGGSPGASAMVAYAPADRTIVAVALTGDAPAAAVANAVFKALRAGGK